MWHCLTLNIIIMVKIFENLLGTFWLLHQSGHGYLNFICVILCRFRNSRWLLQVKKTTNKCWSLWGNYLKKKFLATKTFDLVEPRLMKKGHWMFLNNIFSYLTSKLEIQDGCHMHDNQLITILHCIY